jgi:hypothetical protein
MQFAKTITLKSSLPKLGAAFLLVSFGCGNSSTGSTEDGGVADGGNTTDGTSSTDVRSSTDAKSGDTGSGTDGNVGIADAAVDVVFIDAGSMLSTLPVDLGTAGNYVILSESGIMNSPTSAITGSLGVSPIESTAITGLSLVLGAGAAFSTSSQVTGMIYAPDYAAPTATVLTAAIGDMTTAFTDAAGRAPNEIGLETGKIGGLTLSPGVYKWSTAVTIATNLTLEGGSTDVWIFQIAQDLTISSATSVVLTGGAVSKNIFWQVAGSAVTLGTTSHLEGVVLAMNAIALDTGASVNGRLLSQKAVTLEGNIVVQPAP